MFLLCLKNFYEVVNQQSSFEAFQNVCNAGVWPAKDEKLRFALRTIL